MDIINLNNLSSTFLIAEVGINHNGDINKAKELIDAASESGYDAVKFQTYKTETRIPDIKHDIFNILKKCELEYSDFNILKEYSEKKKIEFMSTVFDTADYNYLESIDTLIFKISSFDLTNLNLINEVSKSNKAIILSTGMGVSSYPLLEENSNLRAIVTLKERYECPIGYSDHTNGTNTPIYSVAVGSKIIEKHFKIDDDCVDASVSIDIDDSKKMIKEIRNLEKILGTGIKNCLDVEKNTKIFRKDFKI